MAAYATTRALFSLFSGALYQVRKPNNATLDIPVLAPGGFANTPLQDAFCASTSCVISRIYDQTSLANHLDIAPLHVGRVGFNKPVNASKDRLTAGGVPVYSAFFEGGMGYRNDAAKGTAVGDAAQTIYMVTSGIHFNDRCCEGLCGAPFCFSSLPHLL